LRIRGLGFRGVGHGHGRAIDQHDTTATPYLFRGHLLMQRSSHPVHEAKQKPLWQASTSFAVCARILGLTAFRHALSASHTGLSHAHRITRGV
jgi:hypothetical protein